MSRSRWITGHRSWLATAFVVWALALISAQASSPRPASVSPDATVVPAVTSDAAPAAPQTPRKSVDWAAIDPDSPFAYELTKSLREVSGAARSLRLLAGYLERNPRALIFGKPEANKD